MVYYQIHFKLMMVAGLEKDEEKTTSKKARAERSTTFAKCSPYLFPLVVFNDDSFLSFIMMALVVSALFLKKNFP